MQGTDSIRTLKGVGEKTEKLFAKIGVYTVKDLVKTYPRYYNVYDTPSYIEDIIPGEKIALRGVISSPVTLKRVRQLALIICQIEDESGKLTVNWYNMPYLKKTLRNGQTYVFVGIPVFKNNKIILEQPEIFTVEDYKKQMETLQPVYPLTQGLSNKMVQKAMKQSFPYMEEIEEPLPSCIIEKYQLWGYQDALREIHFPTSREKAKKARERLVFDEFFLFLAGIQFLKEEKKKIENQYQIPFCEEAKIFLDSLPYTLTDGQKLALEEMKNDLIGQTAMNRLVQGDVGSGKTILAVILLLMTAKAGYQGALMAPTEVLANQHYETLNQLLKPYGISIALLVGSMTQKEKRLCYEQIEAGKIQIIIGTHALIQEKVNYHSLALVITDEQHRFGVKQRENLSKKGKYPHILVMSATPIPRTLALIVYGDMDISVIRELPKNRLPIKNCVVDKGYRPSAYRFIEKQVNLGRQAYVICPMVEDSETLDVENVTEYAKILRRNLPNYVVVESLHGKMRADEKQDIMNRFEKGEIHVLVSTTVIEVGINVPNATVMMIENAERFGLAQLHQLRGRVGRGKEQSYCIFLMGKNSKEAKERLKILEKSNDGFYIASEDLKLRGPGDFFGIRQSGTMDFALADIYENTDLLKAANEAVLFLKEKGYELTSIYREEIHRQMIL
ncbi:MAG: ATP-dependent DNA helicase RecG [Lachnospiraceae bacterium]